MDRWLSQLTLSQRKLVFAGLAGLMLVLAVVAVASMGSAEDAAPVSPAAAEAAQPADAELVQRATTASAARRPPDAAVNAAAEAAMHWQTAVPDESPEERGARLAPYVADSFSPAPGHPAGDDVAAEVERIVRSASTGERSAVVEVALRLHTGKEEARRVVAVVRLTGEGDDWLVERMEIG